MKLPFPYARWERSDSGDATDLRASGPLARNGHAAASASTESKSAYRSRIDRLDAALRDVRARIASDDINDLVAFDRIAAEIATALADYRSDCAAIIEMRSGAPAPPKREGSP